MVAEILRDWELILQFQNGNQNAFETLYNRYADRLYSFVVHQIGNHTADDVFQDIMINVQRHLSKFNPDGNFRAWLVRIAINKIHDQRRKENRMKKLFIWNARQSPDIEAGNDSYAFEYTDAPDSSVKCINDEISAILHKAVQKLPEDQREVVHLHYIMGLTFREIAEIMACSINTISARARYGLKNIKKILGPTLVNELK